VLSVSLFSYILFNAEQFVNGFFTFTQKGWDNFLFFFCATCTAPPFSGWPLGPFLDIPRLLLYNGYIA